MESIYSLVLLTSLFLNNLEASPVSKRSISNAHIDSIHLRLGVINKVVSNMVRKFSLRSVT